jgi:phenylalanyl-tRNA synthetase beta chain
MQMSALQSVEVFAVYHGEGMPDGRKSLSLRLILQEFSRTLTDKEIEQNIEEFVTRVSRKLGAKLRNA